MKRSDLIAAMVFVAIVGFTFSTNPSSKVFGQTSSSSSGSTTSSESTSSSGQTEISSSGSISSSSTSSSGETSTSSSSSSSSGDASTSSTSSTSSSSSTGGSAALSDGYNGAWKAEVDRTVLINGTEVKRGKVVIGLKLCVDNGTLKGIVEQAGLFRKAVIDSQNIISENEVEVTLKNIKGESATLHLTLTDGILNGTFANGVSFAAKLLTKENPQRICTSLGILPNSSSSGSISSSGTTSSSGSTSSVSTDLTGLWQAKIDRTVTVNGTTIRESSRVISLRLCVIDGQLKGIVHHPGFFKNSLIVSSEVTSPTEVKITLKDILGRTAILNLTLNADTLTGTFDNGVTFNAIKRNNSNPRSVCSKVGDSPTQ